MKDDDTLNTINKIMYEMHLMRDSIKGYVGCRVDYTPDDIDHIIVDLLELKKVWRDSLK